MPYTPTRLEWLALSMEAQLGQRLSPEDPYSVSFVELDSENTILIYARYLPTLDRRILNTRIENAKEVIRLAAQAKGWSSWLKIREDVKMQEVNPN